MGREEKAEEVPLELTLAEYQLLVLFLYHDECLKELFCICVFGKEYVCLGF